MQCYGELMREQGISKDGRRRPTVDKNSVFASQVAARIISMSMYKYKCDFTEISRLFDTYPKIWTDLINNVTELYYVGKSERLEYTIDFIGELLNEERCGVGRLCGKDGTPVVVKYYIGLDSQEYHKINQWLFEENVRYSRLSTATPLRSITENFIAGSHSDPLISLSDNTVSAWYSAEHQCIKYIKARVSPEDRCYKADFIFKSRAEVLEEIGMLLDEEKAEIWEKSGYCESEFYKLSTHLIIEYCSNYAVLFITEYDDLNFDSVEDLLFDLKPIKEYVNYKELSAAEKERILSEVGITA